jgi:hypothetical protein
MRARLSPSRYISTHSASGARRNRLSIMGTILPRPPARIGGHPRLHRHCFRASAGAAGCWVQCLRRRAPDALALSYVFDVFWLLSLWC